jgi:phage FluMu gp28-like protein
MKTGIEQKLAKPAKVPAGSSSRSLRSSCSTPAAFPGRAKNRPARDTLMLPYQVKFIRDESRLILVEKSRQIGFSWATAYKLVTTTSLDSTRFDDWVSSRDDLQARLLIEDCKNFARLLKVGVDDLGMQIVDESRNSAFVLQYANGHRTHSLTSNPDAQAGKRGRRILDEFALHKDQRQLYAIAYPGITWGGSMEMISTHRGSYSLFNELVQEVKHKGNPKKISLHTVTLQDALDQGFLYKLQSKLPADAEQQQMDEADYFNFIRSGCPDEETFLQEFCCIPADDNAAFLSYELITSCEYPEATRNAEFGMWKSGTPHSALRIPYSTAPLFVGVDVGRDHDLTVIWVIEKLGGVNFTRQIIILKAETFDAQEHALYEILALPQVRRCCIDCTGIGRQFSERAQKRFGEYKVEAVTFTGPVKEELAYPVRAAFEDKTIRIPNDPLIRSDLRAIKKETTAAGNIRFTADRGKNGHADRFWALALALHAGKTATDAGPIHVFTNTRVSRAIATRRERSLVA